MAREHQLYVDRGEGVSDADMLRVIEAIGELSADIFLVVSKTAEGISYSVAQLVAEGTLTECATH